LVSVELNVNICSALNTETTTTIIVTHINKLTVEWRWQSCMRRISIMESNYVLVLLLKDQ